jgi:hypothetical protein
MESQNKYIGDESFKKFLGHYGCPTPLPVVKMKFAGAVCSPNLDLRPADVISSFWPAGQAPRLETKNEADLFFKFFMGLWDEVFQKVRENKIKLEPVKLSGREQIREACAARFAEVEGGYVEGFWGGREDFKLPAFIAQMIDSLTELSGVYNMLAKKLDKAENLEEISNTFRYTDKMVEKAVSFIIENSVLPRIDSLQRVVH